MRSSKILSGVAVLIGVAAFTGCTDEPYGITQEEQYARDFIDRYGIPAADHDWTMAATVKANIKVEGLTQGTIEIYTAAPGTPEARLAARIPITASRSGATASISLPAGMDCAYARVMDQGNTIRSVAKLPITDGSMTNTFRVSPPPPEGNLPTVEDYEFSALFLPYTIRDVYKEYLKEHIINGDSSYTAANEWFKTTGRTYQVDPSNNGWYSDELVLTQSVLTKVPELKMLDGLYYEMGEAISFRNYLSPIFDHYHVADSEETRDGVFKEGQNNIELYYHNKTGGIQLDPTVTFKVLEEGPVTMQCIWRGTQYSDHFGYYYYKKGEILTADRLFSEIPKYTFLSGKDVQESSDVTQYVHISETTDKDPSEDEWINLDGMATSSCPSWITHNGDDDRLIRGRKYYLAYFGENYDDEPSYTFPKDVQIGYFLFVGDRFFFSDCPLQYQLAYAPYNHTSLNPPVDLGLRGRPYAGKFMMQDRTYLGIGDGCNDCDLNDLVFITENVYPVPTDITPAELGGPTEVPDDEEPAVKPLTWTLACEDLGSTDDVDFNDIVLDIEYVAGTSEITLIPRAAGGTLVSNIYFREGNNTDYTHIGEIHGLMSDKYTDSYPMLNTYGDHHEVDPKSVKRIKLTVPEDFVISDLMERIRITTRSEDDTEADANVVNAYTDIEGAGKIPQMLLLSGEWHWPTERTGITTAYPRFADWVKDTQAIDWVDSRVASATVSHRKKCSH